MCKIFYRGAKPGTYRETVALLRCAFVNLAQTHYVLSGPKRPIIRVLKDMTSRLANIFVTTAKKTLHFIIHLSTRSDEIVL